MGQALNIPVVGVSTLKALAWNLFGVSGLICPILDAKKNEVYTCIYKSTLTGLEELIDPAAMCLERLFTRLQEYHDQIIFLGDGVPVFGHLITEKLRNRAAFASMANSLPRAAAVAELGLMRLKEGRLSDPTFLQPVYLRKSEAEITWEAKHGQGESGKW